MKFNLASAAAIISFVSSAAATPVNARPLMPFGAYASPEGTTAHLAAIQARGQALYVAFDGNGPATYCPLQDKKQCPPGTTTVFALGPNASGGAGTTAGLSVNVPGGQQLYVRSDGSIGYTQAHSASVPTGALRSGFKYTSLGEHGRMEFVATEQKVLKGKKWYACPPEGQGNGAHTKTAYKLYINIRGWQYEAQCEALARCIPVSVTTTEYHGSHGPIGAWQYT